MGCSQLSHFAKRMVDVAFVKLVVAAAINDGTAKGFVRPFHTSRQDVHVTGQHDNVCVGCGWCKRSEFVVQIRVNLDFHDVANFKNRIENW